MFYYLVSGQKSFFYTLKASKIHLKLKNTRVKRGDFMLNYHY